MKKDILFFKVSGEDGLDLELTNTKEKDGIAIYSFKLSWTPENAENDSTIAIDWEIPMLSCFYKWSPLCGPWKCVHTGLKNSMLSVNAPVDCIYDGNGNNRYCYAVSECAKNVKYGCYVVEETANAAIKLRISVAQYTGKLDTTFDIYIDTRKVPMHEAVRGIADWWANDCGMTPAYVPEIAKEPLYSFWYSYHQNLTDKDIEDECRRAKELGFGVCIVDDGWQTADLGRGYGYCGDWKPEPTKIPDMAAHVARVHDIGMKYVLWYSVPFIGYYSENYKRFENKLLYHQKGLQAGVVDPRYKEVREFLKKVYVKALTEWKLDGFKLDFIDEWRDMPNNAPYNEEMDIPALQDAVDVFMTDVSKTLKAINPDIMIEFRQRYIGPNMRKYGNMFRVGDCPDDYTSNRFGVLDLRMHLGDSAVHSDMLMWHKDETPENAAIQIINVLFGVLQYSFKLDGIRDDIKKMSKFWLSFMKEHKSLLLDVPVASYEPHMQYTWAKTVKDDECAIAVYSTDKCVKPDDVKTIYIANGTCADRVVVDITGEYNVRVYNCMGVIVCDEVRKLENISSINTPTGGLVVLERR